MEQYIRKVEDQQEAINLIGSVMDATREKEK